MDSKEESLIKYVRNRNNDPVGVVMAVLVDGQVSLGWATAQELDKNPSLHLVVKNGVVRTYYECKFDKVLGKKVAFNRATRGSREYPPRQYSDLLGEMYQRALRYYKQIEVINV